MSIQVVIVNRMKVGSLDFQEDLTYKKDREKIEELLTQLLKIEGIFSKQVHHINTGMTWDRIATLLGEVSAEDNTQGVLVYLCEDLNAMHSFPSLLTTLCGVHLAKVTGFSKLYFKDVLTDICNPMNSVGLDVIAFSSKVMGVAFLHTTFTQSNPHQ